MPKIVSYPFVIFALSISGFFYNEALPVSIEFGSETQVEKEWRRILLPWGEWLYPPTTVSYLIEELRLPEISGKELAKETQFFREQWKKYEKERGRIANLLSNLADSYEKQNNFAKALALYERLWVEFPEQQNLITLIKRQHTLFAVPVDLSSPEKTLQSLKRALFVYELTASSFGITQPNRILYVSPEDEIRKAEKYLKETAKGWNEDKNLWRLIQGFIYAKVPKITVEDKPVIDVIESLVKDYNLPIVLTTAARKMLEKEKKIISFNTDEIPAGYLLKEFVLKDFPKLVTGPQFLDRLYC
jgi:hypothetical protein